MSTSTVTAPQQIKEGLVKAHMEPIIRTMAPILTTEIARVLALPSTKKLILSSIKAETRSALQDISRYNSPIRSSVNTR